jgi:hypothetical protein
MNSEKCISCGMDVAGFKCADCGDTQTKREEKSCDCPADKFMPRCSRCQEAEVNCDCPAGFM